MIIPSQNLGNPATPVQDTVPVTKASPTKPASTPTPTASKTTSTTAYKHVSAAQSLLGDYASGIGGFFHHASDDVGHAATGVADNVEGAAKTATKDVGNAVTGAARDVKNLVQDAGSEIKSGVGDAAKSAEGLLPKGVQNVIHNMLGKNPLEESPTKYGELGEITPNTNGKEGATYKELDESGQTSANGNNIPADAVKNKNVVVLFQGINGSNSSYTNTFGKYMDSSDDKVDLNQPILSIHEGDRPTVADEAGTIVKDWTHMKSVEAGGDADLQQAFKTDPAVQTGYNVLAQALNAGDHVTVLAHSGGGAESAEALNLLASQGYGDKIKQDVKYVSFAGAASQQDAVDAGVNPKQALYLGTTQDAVAEFGHTYVDPTDPIGGGIDLVKSLSQATDWNLGTAHSPTTIIPGGINHLEDVIDNGQGGGTYLSNATQDISPALADDYKTQG